MALFQNSRIFSREADRPARRRAASIHFALLIAAALALLITSRFNAPALDPVRAYVIAWTAPVVATASRAVTPVNRALALIHTALVRMGDVEQLRTDNARLTALAAHASDLEVENRHLRRLARYAGVTPASPVSARVVASAAGPLSRTILIDAGRNQGVKDGAPVIGENGLIGRVVQAHFDTATIMLLGDRLSRVPVQIGPSHIHAVLTGTGTALPHLDYIAGDATPVAGDLVTTSGLGGVFPRGLAIGTLARDATGWHIDLSADQDAPTTVAILQAQSQAADAAPAPAKDTVK